MGVKNWPGDVEEVLSADQAVAFAYVTPAQGVVVTPVTNFALHDRDAGTVTVNTSVGAPRKLERLRREPRVALAFHTRAHSRTGRTEYVLVQGTASLSEPVPDYPATIRDHWERAAGPVHDGALGRRWLRIYHLRVAVEIEVERIVVWPNLACSGRPAVHGPPIGRVVAPQTPPAKGTAPRVEVRRAVRRLGRLPDVLLGWVGNDGFPVVVPVTGLEAEEAGIALTTAVELPDGGRRAGLVGHAFTRHVVGQRQRVHTGWLDVGPYGARYAPHTERGYLMPPSRLIYDIVVGFETRRREGRPAPQPPTR